MKLSLIEKLIRGRYQVFGHCSKMQEVKKSLFILTKQLTFYYLSQYLEHCLFFIFTLCSVLLSIYII